jgi:hypothetical protein
VWYLIDVTVVNSYFLYNLPKQKPQLTLRRFSYEVVNTINGVHITEGFGRTSSSPTNHFNPNVLNGKGADNTSENIKAMY